MLRPGFSGSADILLTIASLAAVATLGLTVACSKGAGDDDDEGAEGRLTDDQGDAGDVAPAPAPQTGNGRSCGNPGQFPCRGVCEPGTRLDSGTQRCVACGGDGQTYCFDGPNDSGNRKCNDGTRFDSMTRTCIACGNDGQFYCFTHPDNMGGDKKCNAGTRLDPFTLRCKACGGDGQTFCLTGADNASGDKKCNDGTRYDSSRLVCISCGGSDQTCCVDDPKNVSGKAKCNDGSLYCNSMSFTCAQL